MPFPACVPELTDGVVRLRAHRPEDAGRIVEQCTDPETLRWTTVPRPYRLEEAREFLALDRGGVAGRGRARATGPSRMPGTRERRYLGTVDLRPRGGGAAETGFGLHPDGRGWGSWPARCGSTARWWFGQGGVRVHWAAGAGQLRLVAGGVVVRVHPPRHAPAGRTPTPTVARRSTSGGPASAPTTCSSPQTPWADPPVLGSPEAGGIRLRPWRDDDVAHLEPRDQPDHYMPARGVLDADTFPEWLMVRRERMSLGTVLSWCVADAGSDVALGEVLVFVHEGTLDDDTAELGYQLLPSARGRGAATAAAAVLVEHAFSPRADGGLGMRRLVAVTAEDNVREQRGARPARLHDLGARDRGRRAPRRPRRRRPALGAPPPTDRRWRYRQSGPPHVADPCHSSSRVRHRCPPHPRRRRRARPPAEDEPADAPRRMPGGPVQWVLTWLPVAVIPLMGLLLFSRLNRPITDPDTFWHLRLGSYLCADMALRWSRAMVVARGAPTGLARVVARAACTCSSTTPSAGRGCRTSRRWVPWYLLAQPLRLQPTVLAAARRLPGGRRCVGRGLRVGHAPPPDRHLRPARRVHHRVAQDLMTTESPAGGSSP